MIAYLDNAATTRLHPEVHAAMEPALRDFFGNPSSIHAAGRAARRIVEDARERIAACLGCDPGEVVFTSCATEANNLALFGACDALRARGDHVVTSAVEHPSVLEACARLEARGFRVTRVPVDADGRIEAGAVGAALTERTVLVSVMAANNEVGTVQPIAGIARAKGHALLHTDAAQAMGKIPVGPEGVDLLTFSAHKIHGPKGIGGLFVRKGTPLFAQIVGGGQEFERRAGTENVALIAGFACALDRALRGREKNAARMEALRARLKTGLAALPDARENGHPSERLPSILNVSFEGVEGEAAVLALDAEGVCVSTGSACASMSLEPSPVLRAMGLSAETVRASVRFSVAADTGDEEIALAIEKVPKVVERLRRISPVYRR